MASDSTENRNLSQIAKVGVSNSEKSGNMDTQCKTRHRFLHSFCQKPCTVLQWSLFSRHIFNRKNDLNIFPAILMRKLRLYVLMHPNSTKQTVSDSLSMYGNFSTMFKLPSVVHCECSKEDAAQKVQNSKVHQYKAAADSLHAEVLDCIAKETVKERFALIFKPHYGEYEQLSPQLQVVNQTIGFVFATAILGGMLRGLLRGRAQFLERNQGTSFFDNSHATRRLQEEMFRNGLKDALKFALKLIPMGVLTVGLIQSISVYRNKSSPLEYTVAIGLAFALGNVNRGPKGMFSGAVFGSLFGFVAGSVLWGVMKKVHLTQEEIHYKQIEAHIEDQRMKRRCELDCEPSDVDMA